MRRRAWDVPDGAADDRARFAAALRRLSLERFTSFVADLWAARGRHVSRDGTTLTVRDPDRDRVQRLVVTHDDPDALEPTDDTTHVVTSRRGERHAGEPSVVDADELLQTVRYAIDRDRAGVLLERHLGEADVALLSGDGADTFGDVDSRSRWPPRGWDRPAVALLVVCCVVAIVAVVVAAPPVNPLTQPSSAPASGDAGESATPTPTTPTSTPEQTRTPLDYEALNCPRPPTDLHPVRLRPGVVPGASSNGLDGWRILSSQNYTTFEERQMLGLPTEPVRRHTARYQSPDGSTFELALDQWESTPVATAIGPTLSADSDVSIRWGVYTVTVWGFEPDGARESPDARTGRAEVLVSYVHRPSGIRLGDLCVRSLRAENA